MPALLRGWCTRAPRRTRPLATTPPPSSPTATVAYAALHDRSLKQAAAGRRDEREGRCSLPPADVPASVTFCRIAAERGDVVAHPAKRGTLIREAIVAGRGIGGILQRQDPMSQEPERPQPVVWRHHDNALLAREPLTIVTGKIGRGGNKAAGV